MAKIDWRGYYDVVILPPPAVRDYAIDLSRRLNGSWTLGTRRFLPHISIYHIPVRAAEFVDFASVVRRIAHSTDWDWLETTGFDMPVLQTSKPGWLDRLHRRVVRGTLKYLHREYRPEKTWKLDLFSGRRLEFAKEYLKRYGTPMYGMNFRPHITLSKTPGGIELPFRRMRFKPDRLHICQLGESHSCHEIVSST